MKSLLNSIARKRVAFAILLSITFSTFTTSFANTGNEDGKGPIPEVKLFPNPASQILNVQLPDNVLSAELSISSMFGQELVKTNLITGAIFAVNLDNLIDGIYLVSITTDGRTAKYKLVIRR
jgi:aminopeptidase YwaD